MGGKIFNNKLDGADFATGENFAELFNGFTKDKEIMEGSVVTGAITAISNDAITVDIGIKDEGRIPIKEFVQNGRIPELKLGDNIEVYVQSYENRYGKVVLSREKAVRESSWNKLEISMKKGEQVQGVVFGRIKGGLTVDLNGVIAFLPGSQVDVKPVKDISVLIGVVQPFIVLKMDRDQGNVVVSRRAIIEESRAEAKGEMLSKIKVGQVLDGVVKNITDYGAFLDLGSIDGLLHVTDISWNRINHPSEVLSIGQNVKVQVIKYDADAGRVSLGMKQLEQNPWEGLDKKYPIGTRMKGKVTNIADYGVFVQLEPGIEGLVHVSELSWTRQNISPRKFIEIDQEVEFMILDIDVNKHRISLGIKQCTDNIWQSLSEKYAIGTIIEGVVENVVDFGVFINFGECVSALVHANDISWDKKPEELLKNYKKGDKVRTIVLSVDPEKERINVGIKQLDKDPFEEAFEETKKGDVITCVVKAIETDGILVEIAPHVTSFIKRADLSNDKVEQRPERFAIEDLVDAKVVKLDKVNRSVALSIKTLEAEEQKQKIAEYGSASSGASLGDILGKAMHEVEEKKKGK